MDYSKLSDDEINLLVVQKKINCGHFTIDQKDTSGKRYTSGGWDWGKGTGMGLFDRDGAEHVRHENGRKLDYCNNAADAWPIIVGNAIGVMPFKKGEAEAWSLSAGLLSNTTVKDKNPLRAAMIVYLMMQESE